MKSKTESILAIFIAALQEREKEGGERERGGEREGERGREREGGRGRERGGEGETERKSGLFIFTILNVTGKIADCKV